MSHPDHALERLVRPEPAFVQIERDDLPGESGVQGFVLDFTEELLLVQVVTDFRHDGFCILRRDDLTDCRRNRFEVHYQTILEAEGVKPLEGADAPKIDLTNWTTALASLHQLHEWIIAEREVPEDDFFVIGPVVRAGEKSFSVHHFDALGQFEPSATLIKYPALTKVVFGSDYLRVWRRHIPAPPVA